MGERGGCDLHTPAADAEGRHGGAAGVGVRDGEKSVVKTINWIQLVYYGGFVWCMYIYIYVYIYIYMVNKWIYQYMN